MDFGIQKIFEKDFPKQLLEIPDIPKMLYLVGAPLQKDGLYLSVVGSRSNTRYGADVCENLIQGLAGSSIIIVSGLALGIDSIAHKSAMKAGLKTIAFPGSGLSEKVLYPATNISLAKEILATGGTLISENEPNFKSTIWSFPRRNRLMAGISKAVLVIEANEKSGTIITARLALDYNRDVLAVPGPITSSTSSGTNRLIRQGAVPITCSNDILEIFGLKQKSLFDEREAELANLSQEEKDILEFLNEPQLRDDIIANMNKSVSEINSILSTLEIKGLIKEELGEVRKVF